MNLPLCSPFRRHRFRKPVIVLVSALAMWCCSACSDQKPVGPPEKVTIACSTATDAVLAVVAYVQGYYRQEGLEVTLHLHPYGKPALKEVLEGKADIATVAETPVMFEIMNGGRIAILTTIQTSSRDNAIVARKDKGIHVVRDLKGKKLAETSGTTAEFYLDAFLAAHRIARKEVRVVDLKAEEMSDALANGDVDAISTFNPYIFQAQSRLGDRGVSFVDENLYTWTFNMVAKQEFIRNNPEKIKKLLRALLRSEGFVRENPEKAEKIVADFSRMDMALVRRILAGAKFQVALDQSLVLAMEDESRWAIKEGLTRKAKVPNYLDYIYFDGLKSVKPEAVRILR